MCHFGLLWATSFGVTAHRFIPPYPVWKDRSKIVWEALYRNYVRGNIITFLSHKVAARADSGKPWPLLVTYIVVEYRLDFFCRHSAVGSALVLGARSREFESPCWHHWAQSYHLCLKPPPKPRVISCWYEQLISRNVRVRTALSVGLQTIFVRISGEWRCYSHTNWLEDTLDECPMAYKNINDIVDNIQETVDIKAIVKPIYNYKASEA